MNISTRRHRRPPIILAVAVAALLALVGIGLYGFEHGPDSRSDSSARSDDIPAPTAVSTSAPIVPALTAITAAPRPIDPTTDPEMFARRVAEALFAWDTASNYGPVDHAQVVVDVGDPTGNETAGLASDVHGYLPTTQAWAQLRQFQTRQWLDVEAVIVSDAWSDAVDQAVPGQILPGTIAYTITGTRHRSGRWASDPVGTTHPVAFTVFVTCAPAFDTCHLLRLSGLDNPLR
ncbi:hypothetical protein GCM10022381_13010 [Leifsonia kafniensis]|uniref:Uncharacterized protein n=1 Tax=Leifsonia kafniensis TaxID=475957 RepID=A0ABP7KCA3_9MICO